MGAQNEPKPARDDPSLRERRSLTNYAHGDRAVAPWAARRLGLSGPEASVYVEEVVSAGEGSAGGRGGFDKIVADLGARQVSVDAVRTRYAIAMAELDVPAYSDAEEDEDEEDDAPRR